MSILYRIAGDPGYPFSEAVGVVQRVEEPAGDGYLLQVLKRNGALVAVPSEAVVALKVVSARGGPVGLKPPKP